MDSKRILRAISEIIPHFFVSMVLNYEPGPDCAQAGDEPELQRLKTISKWNQPENIIADCDREKFKENLKSWSTETFESLDSKNDRFNILFSLLTNQGIRRFFRKKFLKKNS